MYKLADVLAEDKKPYIAMDVLNILQIKPDFTDAAIFLGNLAYDARFFDRAESAYELAAKNGNAEAVFGFKNMAYELACKSATTKLAPLKARAKILSGRRHARSGNSRYRKSGSLIPIFRWRKIACIAAWIVGIIRQSFVLRFKPWNFWECCIKQKVRFFSEPDLYAVGQT